MYALTLKLAQKCLTKFMKFLCLVTSLLPKLHDRFQVYFGSSLHVALPFLLEAIHVVSHNLITILHLLIAKFALCKCY